MNAHDAHRGAFQQSLMPFSVVRDFTRSALSTILLSAGHSNLYDYATLFAALRRHLSTKSTDRLFCEESGYHYKGDPLRFVKSLHFLKYVASL